jgi:hypothetical protein
MPSFLVPLILHGILGAIDVLLNHELVAGLPHQPAAAREQALHSARELVFALLFLSLAWFAWQGICAVWIVLLVMLELLVSIMDMATESRQRVLPISECVTHLLLYINLGFLLCLLIPALQAWWQLSTGLVRVDYGATSLLLSAMGLGSLAWSVRDARAALRLRWRAQIGQYGAAIAPGKR